jgi:hypothetical protein
MERMSFHRDQDIRSICNILEVRTMARARVERASPRQTRGSMLWILAAGLLWCSLPPAEAAEMDKATIDAIEFVARQHRANKEKIVTWKGDVVIHSTMKTPQERQETTASVAYALDTAGQKSRWNWKTTDARLVVGDKINELPRFTNNGLIADGAFYRLKTSGQDTGVPHNQIAIHDPAVEPRHYGNDDFEPTWFLTDYGEDICERLLAIRGWVASPKTPDMPTVDAKLDGNILTLELSRPGNNGFNRYRFDLSQGGNMISYSGKDSTTETENGYQYLQVGDIWVLAGMERKMTRKTPEGAVLRESTRTFEWTANSVNVPLANTEFSLEAIGARPGDMVYDQIIGMRYRFRTEGLTDGLRELGSSDAAPEGHVDRRQGDANRPFSGNEAQGNTPLKQMGHNANPGFALTRNGLLLGLTLGFLIAGLAAATIHHLKRSHR